MPAVNEHVPHTGPSGATCWLASRCTGEPVGIVEIADRVGVNRQTVDNWQQRSAAGFPPPRWRVGGRPAWSWQLDIEPWARETGRIR
jgi:hypothetical protein